MNVFIFWVSKLSSIPNTEDKIPTGFTLYYKAQKKHGQRIFCIFQEY